MKQTPLTVEQAATLFDGARLRHFEMQSWPYTALVAICEAELSKDLGALSSPESIEAVRARLLERARQHAGMEGAVCDLEVCEYKVTVRWNMESTGAGCTIHVTANLDGLLLPWTRRAGDVVGKVSF